jgi:hypothetical protein
MPKSVRIKAGITADQVGCDQEYFEKYIKSKKLTVIYETKSGYIRVTDQQGEEWGLFQASYKVLSERKKVQEGLLVQRQAGASDGRRSGKPDYQWTISED